MTATIRRSGAAAPSLTPLYGEITLDWLADRDIAWHDCAEHARARDRLIRRRTDTAA